MNGYFKRGPNLSDRLLILDPRSVILDYRTFNEIALCEKSPYPSLADDDDMRIVTGHAEEL